MIKARMVHRMTISTNQKMESKFLTYFRAVSKIRKNQSLDIVQTYENPPPPSEGSNSFVVDISYVMFLLIFWRNWIIVRAIYFLPAIPISTTKEVRTSGHPQEATPSYLRSDIVRSLAAIFYVISQTIKNTLILFHSSCDL